MKMQLDSSQRCTMKGKRQQPQVVPREIWMRHREEASWPMNYAALWQGLKQQGDCHPWGSPNPAGEVLESPEQPDQGWKMAPS